jgi:DNA-binding transcriptional MerR regulator
LSRRFYHTGEFAQKAAVSVRTLRFYDREGLLSPTGYSEAGYRLYSDDDLAELQQVLAFKFLGFTLDEIKRFMRAGPQTFAQMLARQKAMMRDKRDKLGAIIRAIEHTEALLEVGECDWGAISHVIEVIQTEQKTSWVNKYFTSEQQKVMKQLDEASYSDEAKAKMAGWGRWTEEDQRRVDVQYAHLAAELKRLVAEGKDPASPKAQALAKLQADLLGQFTQGDPDIEAGLNTWWKNYDALPQAEKPPALPWTEEEGVFLGEAMRIYRQREASGGG